MSRRTIHLDPHTDGTTTATFVIAGKAHPIVTGPGDEVARVVAVQMPSLCAMVEAEEDAAVPA